MDAVTLTDLIDATWPAAETRVADGWRLRRDTLGGNRVNAATVILPGQREHVDVALAAGARLFMVRSGEEGLDARLAVRGFAERDHSRLLVRGLEDVAPVARDRVVFCEGVPARLRELWAEGGIGPGRIAIMERATGPKTVLLGRVGDRAMGAAYLALGAEGRAMLHALHIDPGARRQGLAGDMMRASLLWAREAGAREMTLIVTAKNGPARALYAGLGFEEAGRYHYRAHPSETA